MKDRIKKLMESQHMTQQVFADFLGMSAATLSGIFTERTRPTLNVVEAIKKKFPDISIDWLMFGKEPMFMTHNVPNASPGQGSKPDQPTVQNSFPGSRPVESLLDFNDVSSPTPQSGSSVMPSHAGVRSTHPEYVREEIKFIDKPQRRVTEIRVYYDDQTWESFVPSKK